MITSHGTWAQAPDGHLFHGEDGNGLGPKVRKWTSSAGGTDWYAYVREQGKAPGFRFISVADSIVRMIGPTLSHMAPDHGEVLQVPDDLPVDLGWLWRGDHAEEPPAPDPVAKITAYLAANPDVKALLGA